MDYNQFILAHWNDPLRDVAKATGLSLNAVKKRRQRMKGKPKDYVQELAALREKKASKKHLDNHLALLNRVNELEEELEGMKQLRSVRETFNIKPYHPIKSEAVAVVVASDWHIEELVDPKKVNGLNAYNLQIAEERARQFFARAARLTQKERQDVEINTLVIALLGDFISGNIHEELLENCLLQPIDAALLSQKFIASGIRFLLETTDLNLVIPCVPGNHGRITKKLHVSTEQGNSLEYFMYHSLAAMFMGEKRVQFVIGDGQHVYLDVMGKTMRFLHGHSVQYQGGVGGVHIPLRKAISQWDKARRADITVLGHFHNYLPLREVVVNGSMIGYNAFALRIKADYEPPSQAFFLIDKKRGHTVRIPILFVEEK